MKSFDQDLGVSRREFLQTTMVAGCGFWVPNAFGSVIEGAKSENTNDAGGSEMPKVWITYDQFSSNRLPAEEHEKCFRDMKEHGIDGVEITPFPDEQKTFLEIARKVGLKLAISVLDISDDDVLKAGLKPEYAVAIGGSYRNLAIDSHTFAFEPGAHAIDIGLPVCYAPYDAARGYYLSSNKTFGRYINGISTSNVVRAEIIVPKQAFDGHQHLVVLPAEVAAKDEETVNVKFQLNGSEGDISRVMIAVYWQVSRVSPAAESTKKAAALALANEMKAWALANGGTFPHDIIKAIRWGDETFLWTGFIHSPVCSIPLYDYSASGVASFRAFNQQDEYPRCWAYPEIYGVNAYRDWLYAFHCEVAQLVKTVVDEAHKQSPDIKIFRNITRFNPSAFATLNNDHDGCSTQLLTQAFDMINPDPYPVSATGDSQACNSDRNPRLGYIDSIIPLEGNYLGGLAHRLGKPYMPWLQAHTFARDLMHPSPEEAERMVRQTMEYRPDSVMWLAYGHEGDPHFSLGPTVPRPRADTWARMGELNRRMENEITPDTRVRKTALVRFYAERALVEPRRVELHDRFLTERIMSALTMDMNELFDVFEYYRRDQLECAKLAQYDTVLFCVRDLEDFPFAQLISHKVPARIICSDSKSLLTQTEWTGVVSGQAVDPDTRVQVSSFKLLARLGTPVTLADPNASLAAAGSASCVWKHRGLTFVSFLPEYYIDDQTLLALLMGRL
jgi:hypothetical protein